MKIKICLMLLLFSTYTLGETIDVEYTSFYSHVKKLQNDDTQALRFAFGFKHIAQQRLCKVSSAKIVTQKQTLPLVIEPSSRFTVPSDKILKMAKAIVVIDIEDQANQCDMSVQLETKPEYLSQKYTNEELSDLLQQYTVFFDDMGGILSFMMPKVEGLVFHFNSNSAFSNSEFTLDKNSRLPLSTDKLKAITTLNFPVKPIRVTALIEK
ncbi:DUF2987 domain-containing protein [Paraglaciecola sp. 2405UD69-4]|uniref:DUF2987 domain-containing protein n=1 Tax=Paraglaciecola sp. 2405UD69-4 TaxID=3391836 RepID=UPI0039C8D303